MPLRNQIPLSQAESAPGAVLSVPKETYEVEAMPNERDFITYAPQEIRSPPRHSNIEDRRQIDRQKLGCPPP